MLFALPNTASQGRARLDIGKEDVEEKRIVYRNASSYRGEC